MHVLPAAEERAGAGWLEQPVNERFPSKYFMEVNMRTAGILFLALVTAVCLGVVPAWAQHGGGHPGGPPGGMPSGTPGMGHEGGSGNAGGMGNSTSTTPTKTAETPSEILSRNTKLSGQISKLTGMNAQDACQGFRNVGLCVASAHVSQNLGIPFLTLRSKVTGGDSLGTAIHSLSPKVNAKAEARKAQKQAKRDISESRS